MNEGVALWLTVCAVDGLMVPFGPADGVTVWVSIANDAVTVQSAVIGFVVYVFPSKVPPQVPDMTA